MHALIEQLAAAREFRLAAPFLFIARPAAMAIAGANIDDLADITGAHRLHKAKDGGVVAMIKAEFQNPAGGFGRDPQTAALAKIGAGRLFHQHMQATAEGGLGDGYGMKIGRGDEQGVKRLAQQRARLGINRDFIDRGRFLPGRGIGIGEAGQNDAMIRGRDLRPAAADQAKAGEAEAKRRMFREISGQL